MLLEYHEHDADGGVAQSLWSLVFITGKVEEKLLAQFCRVDDEFCSGRGNMSQVCRSSRYLYLETITVLYPHRVERRK